MTARQRPGRRIQLSRRRGWRLPPGARSVAYPSKYANPYRPIHRTPAANRAAVEQYRAYLADHPDLVAAARAELAGYDLACWCPPELDCHADVLLDIVNSSSAAGRD